MPVFSSDREVSLSTLKLEKRPITASHVAILLRKPTKQFANQVSKHLLYLWRAGKIVRSSQQLDGEYYYYYSTKSQTFSIKSQRIEFVTYKKKIDSRSLKGKIKSLLKKEGPLSVKEVAFSFRQDSDLTFIKKINFHLQDLYKQGKLLRSSKPYRYYIAVEDISKIDDSKSSVPTLVEGILASTKAALFTSEIIGELRKLNVTPKLSTVSLALKRLSRQTKIVSSKTQFGTRGSNTGYIWAVSSQAIRDRFVQELPASVRELLRKDRITGREISDALAISPTNAQRLLERISQELEFELQGKEVVRNKT
jgi:hypothetical protein